MRKTKIKGERCLKCGSSMKHVGYTKQGEQLFYCERCHKYWVKHLKGNLEYEWIELIDIPKALREAEGKNPSIRGDKLEHH